MTGRLALVFLLCETIPTLTHDGASLCRNKELRERFVEFASPSFDYAPSGLEEAFRPHAAALEQCLERWVEDGGERDGIPLRGNGADREYYRAYALALLGQLHPQNERVASWVRSNMHSWPGPLQTQAVNTLGEIGGDESFSFLKAEARRSEGAKREQIWSTLALLDGNRLAAELEAIVSTHDEQVVLGSILIRLNQPMAVPALQKLKETVPEKAGVYEEYIREFERKEREGHDHEN